MPERHRHHDSTERRELFTITLESCSRSGGIRVHDEVETVITMSRNMHICHTDFIAADFAVKIMPGETTTSAVSYLD
jgi:hypothetical protein